MSSATAHHGASTMVGVTANRKNTAASPIIPANAHGDASFDRPVGWVGGCWDTRRKVHE